jgi:hypothetical protein
MFEYLLPLEAASKPDKKKKPPPKGDDKRKTIHTQAIPEKPGDNLGYDPRKIPVEDI